MERLQHLQIHFLAHAVFIRGAMVRNNMTSECEARYLELFKDMKEHESVWLDGIFSNDGNYVLAERSCGILGTLATIQRSRGDLEDARHTIQVYSKVLKAYQGMCDRCTVQEQKDCCEILTYKHDLVASNTYQQLQLKDKCLPHFRRAVEFELKNGIDYADQNFAFLVPQCLGANNPKYNPLTIPKFRDVPDSKVWKCLITSLQVAETGNCDALPKLSRCIGCSHIEPVKGDFMTCSACKNALYCSVACQRKHWKVHKQECEGGNKKSSSKYEENTPPKNEAPNANDKGNSNSNINDNASKAKETETTSPQPKVNVDDSTLQLVAGVLAQRFATTVLGETKHLISKAHVEGCQPRLVERIKQVLVTKCPHLNSTVGFADGSRDIIFLQEMDKFFLQQPGYEKLEHIMTGRKAISWDHHRKSQCSATTNLRIDQEDLEKDAKGFIDTVAKTILHQFPNFYVTKAQRTKACVEYVDFMKDFLLTHPEYNSYLGVSLLATENPDGFIEKSNALIVELFEIP
jgi:hypothetical protein